MDDSAYENMVGRKRKARVKTSLWCGQGVTRHCLSGMCQESQHFKTRKEMDISKID